MGSLGAGPSGVLPPGVLIANIFAKVSCGAWI